VLRVALCVLALFIKCKVLEIRMSQKFAEKIENCELLRTMTTNVTLLEEDIFRTCKLQGSLVETHYVLNLNGESLKKKILKNKIAVNILYIVTLYLHIHRWLTSVLQFRFNIKHASYNISECMMQGHKLPM
jgi:hypothetical protein